MKIKPEEVVRDEYGFFYHKDYYALYEQFFGEREVCTREEWEEFKDFLNVDMKLLYLQDDAPMDVVDRYFDDDIEVCKDWNPTHPDDGYFIVSIHDTEDGAVCVFVKERSK